MKHPDYEYNVFINCPFDETYKEMFDSIVFTVFDCGYIARCALEVQDGTSERINNIFRIISECKFGIHDISNTILDNIHNLPRFNMPLELGIFLGATHFGQQQHNDKVTLILDKEIHRYQKFISDIAGREILSHNGKIEDAITRIRDWLSAFSTDVRIPGGRAIMKRYTLFKHELPELTKRVYIDVDELTYNDYATFVSEWLKQHERVQDSIRRRK